MAEEKTPQSKKLDYLGTVVDFMENSMPGNSEVESVQKRIEELLERPEQANKAGEPGKDGKSRTKLDELVEKVEDLVKSPTTAAEMNANVREALEQGLKHVKGEAVEKGEDAKAASKNDDHSDKKKEEGKSNHYDVEANHKFQEGQIEKKLAGMGDDGKDNPYVDDEKALKREILERLQRESAIATEDGSVADKGGRMEAIRKDLAALEHGDLDDLKALNEKVGDRLAAREDALEHPGSKDTDKAPEKVVGTDKESPEKDTTVRTATPKVEEPEVVEVTADRVSKADAPAKESPAVAAEKPETVTEAVPAMVIGSKEAELAVPHAAIVESPAAVVLSSETTFGRPPADHPHQPSPDDLTFPPVPGSTAPAAAAKAHASVGKDEAPIYHDDRPAYKDERPVYHDEKPIMDDPMAAALAEFRSHGERVNELHGNEQQGKISIAAGVELGGNGKLENEGVSVPQDGRIHLSAGMEAGGLGELSAPSTPAPAASRDGAVAHR